MTKSEKWLKNRLSDYDFDPQGTFQDMITSTNYTIEQYFKTGKSRTAEVILNSCLEHTTLFLDALDKKQAVEFEKEMKQKIKQ